MNAPSPLTIEAQGDCAIVMTRAFHAPAALVFKAHTTPELVRQWLLGPEGWTMPVCEIDLRPGGAYRYEWQKGEETMGMGGVFQEVDPPHRIVQTEAFDESWYPGEALVTTTFAEAKGMTTMTLTIRYESQGARDLVLASPMAEGLDAGHARLERLLVTLNQRP